ncbi:MAG: thioredoxin family protein [Patescibacteria group bacterium]
MPIFSKINTLIACVVLISAFAFALPAQASTPVTVDFFWGDGCPHCAKEKIFLTDLAKTYGDQIKINYYEVYYNEDNQALLQEFANERGQAVSGVPATFIGQSMTVGFGSADTTGADIQALIEKELHAGQSPTVDSPAPSEDKIRIPLIGLVDPQAVSLPFVTVILAAIDGFNPCAMWVLVMLIGMLIGMQDRRRMWLLGTIFIITSALVYFMFLAAWFNLFKFIGVVRWVQVLIGLVALGIGVYYLRRFWKSRPGVCEVTDANQRRKILDRMKDIVSKKSLPLAIGGIIVLAAIVNLIELACSAGLPAVFTQVVALNELPGWQYYGLLLLYILIFMLDDMIVFAIAMMTMKVSGGTGKYSRYATLIGGIVILLLGIILIARPQLLTLN